MQSALFNGLHWQPDQQDLFEAEGPAIVAGLAVAPAAPIKRTVNREEYASGYRDGLTLKKPKSTHADYLTGFENGAADKRYNKRVSECSKVFGGWSDPVLPGQSEMF